MNYLVLVIYAVVIVLASALGGALPTFFRFTHRRIQLTLSLVSGVMLGVALLHLLPHAIGILQDINLAMVSCLCGLLFMFLLIRTFHFHQHDVAAIPGEAADDDHAIGSHGGHHDCHHGPGHSHGKPSLTELTASATDMGSATDPSSAVENQDRAPVENQLAASSKELSWIGLTIGLALHTLVDGLALAAAYSAERTHGGVAALGTFLAIVLHKPLDALTITSLMSARRASLSQQMVVNLVFALMCPLGALLFAFSFDHLEVMGQSAIGVTLAFSAGVFLCISLGDLLPEVHFHSHDRVWLSLMLLLGVLIAWAIEWSMGHSHAIVP